MYTLSEAIAAIKAGRRDDAREMLRRIIVDDPRNINALLWATEVADSADQRKYFLNRILEIDPHNIAAHKGLQLLEAANQVPSPTLPPKKTDPSLPTLSKVETVSINTPNVKPTTSGKKTGLSPIEKTLLGVIVALSIFVVGAVVISSSKGSTSQSSTSQSSQIERRYPTPTPNLWPELSSMKAYQVVNGLDLAKRAYYYKNKPICLFNVLVYNVQEDQNGTTFMIQDKNDFTIIGSVYYRGSLPRLVDNWVITLGGYVVGSESDLNISSSSRPVILMQRGSWNTKYLNSQGYSTSGTDEFFDCLY